MCIPRTPTLALQATKTSLTPEFCNQNPGHGDQNLRCLANGQIHGFIIPQPIFAFTSVVLSLERDFKNNNKNK